MQETVTVGNGHDDSPRVEREHRPQVARVGLVGLRGKEVEQTLAGWAPGEPRGRERTAGWGSRRLGRALELKPEPGGCVVWAGRTHKRHQAPQEQKGNVNRARFPGNWRGPDWASWGFTGP